MKRLISNIIMVIFGLLAILGGGPKIAKAQNQQQSILSIRNISETTPLYLMHAKHINPDTKIMLSEHWSHYSHESHMSHYSHHSHHSHYSGY